MYKISDVAKIAGVSTRTLRYYDEIDLLKPSEVSESGYRIYTEVDLDKLQQILFYKNLGLSLYDISKIVNHKDFNLEKSLNDTLQQYKSQKEQIEEIIKNIENSLKNLKGEIIMENKKKFETIQQFEEYKQQMFDENEKKYGEEMRQNPQQYDPEMVKYSQKKVKNMTKAEMEENEALGQEIQRIIEEHFDDEVFDVEVAKELYEKHKAWLVFYWGKYVEEAHRGVCDMYIYDERFKAHYDKNSDGGAEYLRKCVYFCTNTEL